MCVCLCRYPLPLGRVHSHTPLSHARTHLSTKGRSRPCQSYPTPASPLQEGRAVLTHTCNLTHTALTTLNGWMVRYGVDIEVWLVGFGWLARRPIVCTRHGREGPKEAVDGWGRRRSERQARPYWTRS